MTNKISRRGVLKTAVGAASALAGSHWVFRIADGKRIIKAQTDLAAAWKPAFFSEAEGQQLAALCEAIIPHTETPGARDARVHEYIDVVMSVESEANQTRFRNGLAWMEAQCHKQSQKGLAQATSEEVSAVLSGVSDANQSITEEMRPGATFFIDLKTRTIFGYYTSREGWVEELGRPEHVGMEKWFGCAHPNGEH